jgi:hypothetical protein
MAPPSPGDRWPKQHKGMRESNRIVRQCIPRLVCISRQPRGHYSTLAARQADLNYFRPVWNNYFDGMEGGEGDLIASYLDACRRCTL